MINSLCCYRQVCQYGHVDVEDEGIISYRSKILLLLIGVVGYRGTVCACWGDWWCGPSF
jgi:hypothetical protein